MENTNSKQQSFVMDDKETVELFFSCRGLKDMDYIGKSDPILTLKKHIHGNKWAEIGRTEVIKNDLNPDFTKSFKLDFIFETKQKFKVEVVDVDNFTTYKGDFLGEAYFELADIVGSLHNMKILKLKSRKQKSRKQNDCGKCIVRLDEVDESQKKEVTLNFGMKEVPKSGYFSSRNVFIKIYKLRVTKAMLERMRTEDIKFENMQLDAWLLVYKSKVMKGKNVTFKQIQMKGSKLCNNNFDIPLKIEMWKYKDSGSHKLMGQCFIAINDLVARKTSFPFQNLKYKSYQTTLQAIGFRTEDYFDFVDFLRGGLNMTQIVGIDFTASNRDPIDPKSLHYLNPPSLNLYQQAILSVGEILQKYNHTHNIPAYGFGAKIGKPPQISQFFPINFDGFNPCVDNFNTLFKAYHHCCQQCIFSGPTLFAPILKQVNEFTEARYKQNPYNYTVFSLMTDGVIQDLQNTIDEIVKGCYLPLSIVIIGIGEEDFTKMDILDADDIPLVSSWGETMKRDIVQFVPFKKYKNNPLVLREEVLDEIPRQVRTFFKKNNIKPKEANYIDTQNINFQRGQTMKINNKFKDLFQNEKQNDYPSLD